MEKNDQLDKVLLQIGEMLQSIRFGTITLVIQDGKIIQLEKNEKVRIQ